MPESTGVYPFLANEYNLLHDYCHTDNLTCMSTMCMQNETFKLFCGQNLFSMHALGHLLIHGLSKTPTTIFDLQKEPAVVCHILAVGHVLFLSDLNTSHVDQTLLG